MEQWGANVGGRVNTEYFHRFDAAYRQYYPNGILEFEGWKMGKGWHMTLTPSTHYNIKRVIDEDWYCEGTIYKNGWSCYDDMVS